MNNTEYFIEPIEEFDASTYEKNEFSFVDFDLNTFSIGVDGSDSNKQPDLKVHLLLKSSSSKPTTKSSSCGLDDING